MPLNERQLELLRLLERYVSRLQAQAGVDYLDDGYSMTEFLDMLPSVHRDHAEEFLRLARGPTNEGDPERESARPLKGVFANITVATVQEQGIPGTPNGALLVRLDGDFDLFITADKNLRYHWKGPPTSLPAPSEARRSGG